jgi:hypothetical protein
MDDLTVIEEQRTHLRAVPYRPLGSVHEADDADQETWLRLQRSYVSDVDNLPAWLTTVVSRICLDQRRSRASRREDLGAEPTGVPRRPGDRPSRGGRARRRGRGRADGSCSTPSRPPSGWASACTTSSGCPSTRSPHPSSSNRRGISSRSAARAGRLPSVRLPPAPGPGPGRVRQAHPGPGAGRRLREDRRLLLLGQQIRRRRDEWIPAGVFETIEQLCLEAYDRIVGICRPGGTRPDARSGIMRCVGFLCDYFVAPDDSAAAILQT